MRLLLALLGVLAGVGGLLLWTLAALLFWLATTTSGLRMVVQTLESTGWVQVGHAEGALLGRMSLKDVVLHAGETRLRVDCAELDWQPLALLRRREVQVDTLWLAGVQVELAPATDAPKPASEPWAGLSLPVAVFVDDLRVDGVSLRPSLQKGGGGDLRRAEPLAQTVPMAPPSPQPSPARGEGVREALSKVGSNGFAPSPPAGEGWGEGDVRGDSQPLWQNLNARFSLEASGLHLQHLQLEGIAGQAGSSIHLGGDWGMQPKDALNVALAWAMPLRLEDGAWLRLAGEGQLTGTLAALHLQHRLTQPLAAQLDAEVQPLTDGLPWSAVLHIEPLRLAEYPALLKLVPPELAPKLGTLAADFKATGTQTMAQIERAEVLQDKTRLNLSGQVAWAEGVHWDVQAEASELHPEIFAQDWPGTLALVAQSAGSLLDGKPVGSFKVERLHGQLRGYPLEASLNAEIKAWAAGLPQLVLETLRLRSGAVRWKPRVGWVSALS